MGKYPRYDREPESIPGCTHHNYNQVSEDKHVPFAAISGHQHDARGTCEEDEPVIYRWSMYMRLHVTISKD